MKFPKPNNLSIIIFCYGIANALAASAPLLLLPIYTHYLTKESFGQLSIVNTMIVLLAAFTNFGTSAALQKKYYDLSAEHFSDYVNTVLVFILMLGLFSLAVTTLFLSNLENNLGIKPVLIYVALATSISSAIQQVLLSIWQSQQKILNYMKLQASSILILSLLSVVFVVFFKLEILGAALAIVTNAVLLAFYCLFTLKDNLKSQFNTMYLKHLILFGYPLFPQLLSGWAISMLDRVLIQKSWGLAAVAAYSFAFQLTQPLSILSAALVQALTPVTYKALTNNHQTELAKIKKIFLISTLILLISALALYFLAKEVILLFFNQYHTSIEFLPWLIIGFFINSIYRLLSIVMMYYEKTFDTAAIVILSAGLSIVLNYHYIPKYGAIAACYTSIAAYFCILFLVTIRLKLLTTHTSVKV